MAINLFAAQFTISESNLVNSLISNPHSIDDQPTKIVTIKAQFVAHLDNAFFATLTTLDDIFFHSSVPITDTRLGRLVGVFICFVRWRKFFEEFRNVKLLRSCPGLEIDIVDLLRTTTGNPPPAQEMHSDATTLLDLPINSNGSGFTFDISPLLEEITVYARTPELLIGEDERASALTLLRSFATARQHVGRPVNVFWNMDRELPRYFTTKPRWHVDTWNRWQAKSTSNHLWGRN